jgi:hypothetical protein
MANKILTATFTPAATSHAGGECVGAAQRFVLASHVAGQSWIIKNSALRIDNGTAEASVFTVHFYSATPPSAIADDAAWDLTAADRAYYLGSLSLGQPADVGTTQYVETQTHNKTIRLPADATGLWGYLVLTTTTTLTASAHVVSLAVEMAK